MTARVPELYKAFPEAVCFMHPDDALAAKLRQRRARSSCYIAPRLHSHAGRDARPQHARRAASCSCRGSTQSELINKVTLDATDPISLPDRLQEMRGAHRTDASHMIGKPIFLALAIVLITPLRPRWWRKPSVPTARRNAADQEGPAPPNARRCAIRSEKEVRNYPEQPPVIPHTDRRAIRST